MKSFTWRFPIELLVNNWVFPDQLLATQQDMISEPRDLVRNRVWLIARYRDTDYLYGHCIVEQVARIEEGIDKGRYILELDRLRSFRILPQQKEHFDRWSISHLSAESGMSPCPFEFEAQIIELVGHNQAKSYAPPSSAKIMAIPDPSLNLSAKAKGRRYFETALSMFPLGELSLWESTKDLSPYGTLCIYKGQVDRWPDDTTNEILVLDKGIIDLLSIRELREPAEMADQQMPAVPDVDTNLRTLYPGKIIARKFLANGTSIDPRKVRDKIEVAEVRHQEIVKDVAVFLSSNSILPLESRSIDMAVKIKDGMCLMEVKSASTDNFLDQIEHAIFQLLRYEMALEGDGLNVQSRVVIIEPARTNQLLDYAIRLAAKVGITVLIYDRRHPWPMRTQGLMDVVSTAKD